MPISHSNSDLAPEKLSRKESSELEYYGSCGGGSGLRSDPGGGAGGTNSNGTINTLTDGGGGGNTNNSNNHNGGGHGDQSADAVEFSEACLTSVKAFFRNKGICGK